MQPYASRQPGLRYELDTHTHPQGIPLRSLLVVRPYNIHVPSSHEQRSPPATAAVLGKHRFYNGRGQRYAQLRSRAHMYTV